MGKAKTREKITLIMPCFNEKWRLGPTLIEIVDFIETNPSIIGEIIVVDDGSTDKTLERVMSIKHKLPLLKIKSHKENKGKWAAIRTGIESAKYNYVLLLDADGSASIRELERLGVEYIQDYVLPDNVALFGSRFLEESVVTGKTKLRKLISKGYRLYVRTMYRYATGKIAPDDLQCPFKLFPKGSLNAALTADKWAGDIELAGLLDCVIADVPVHFVHKGGSKVAKSTVLEMFISTYKFARRVRDIRSSNDGYK